MVLQTTPGVASHEIYNLAGRTSVGLSLEQPVDGSRASERGLKLLKAVRFIGKPVHLYNAGWSERFGDATEATAFRPQAP